MSRYDGLSLADGLKKLEAGLAMACNDSAANLVGRARSVIERPSLLYTWTLVSDRQPRPHARYFVRRDGNIHTATPCYGMHKPWWVPMGINGREYEPVDMLDTDEWAVLTAGQRP